MMKDNMKKKHLDKENIQTRRIYLDKRKIIFTFQTKIF